MVGKANLPVILLDTDGYIVEWSNKVASVTGITVKEAKGHLLSDFLPSSMRPTLNTAVSAACSGLDDVHLDLVLNTNVDGVDQNLPATISMHVSRRMAKETGGMVLMMVGVDVTKQKKLFAQIAAPTNEFDELLELAAAPAFGTDMSGRVNKWNKLMARLCGIEENEVQGLTLIGEVFGRNGRIKVAEQGMQILLELAIAGALVGEISAKPIAITCFLADGRSCNLQMNFGIRRNLKGDQVGTFCFALVRHRRSGDDMCPPVSPLSRPSRERCAIVAVAEQVQRPLASPRAGGEPAHGPGEGDGRPPRRRGCGAGQDAAARAAVPRDPQPAERHHRQHERPGRGDCRQRHA